MASPIGHIINPPDPILGRHPHPHPHPHPHHHSHPHSHPQPQGHLPPHQPPLPPPASSFSLSAPIHSASGLALAPLTAPPSVPAPPTSSASLAPPQQPPRGHASTQSLYQCADCLRRYSRPEHLQRHIATHTLGKRFTCDICSKAFSRADLLKRHRANHQDDNGAKRRRVNSSPGAGRVAHACQACAKARVKCEEMKPCTRCKNRGLSCEYASSEDAAMHLLHLSAGARSLDQSQDSSPEESPYSSSPHHSTIGQSQHAPPAATLSPNSFPPPLSASSVTQAPVYTGHAPVNEEAQLPTPETLMDQSNPDSYQPPYPSNGVVEATKVPFSDFLRDVLYDQSMADPDRLAEAHGLAVLDFCDDANLDLKDIDFGLLDHWNVEGALRIPEVNQSGPDESVDLAAMRSKLVKIWTESPWRWSPAKTDTGYTEQSNLPLSTRDIHGTELNENGKLLDRVVQEKLHTSSRDKILAIVLNTCHENSMRGRVASSFPSADVMDSWVHIFLASHLCQVSAWIHYGSFSLNTQWPEWLAIAASAGAVLAPVPTLRRFGFALQEAVRLTIPSRFEENNKKIADIGLVQALMLVQDVGLWSGNRRKMEIAECHLSIPIAMMRYRGKFKRSAYPSVVIAPSDEGKILEDKWKTWYEFESWKRLVFHAYLRDSQVSMTQFCNPSMSYSELTLPLPCSKELWFARTAEEFKMRYLEARVAEGNRTPSLGDLFRDIEQLSQCHNQLDVQFAISVYLHGFWSLIWEYRQLNSVYGSTVQSSSFTINPSLLLNSRHQELCNLLKSFQIVTSGWHEMLSAQESIVLHLLLMNLHVSLDDLQLFSGKEGEEQARSAYPTLRYWSETSEARHALWHAGQILRQGKLFPPGHLKDFYAVAVHHAALCIWTHGVVTKGPQYGQHQNQQHHNHQQQQQQQHQYQHHQQQNPPGWAEETVFLDGADTPEVQRFIAIGQGRAAIRGLDNRARDASAPPPAVSFLKDPRGCMDVAQEVLRVNFVAGGPESLPPISENIIYLLKQLGGAAWAVGVGMGG
ncbi:hypothetical protein B0H67DRAFT_82858 [Lasiosphaeris hirsuta]|uniref:Uncharacterized protein n=1 Tax=Lasiosphaeris hirsuta TaxID=260670 RepID=A0AA40E822_9PEZI|nr:hypothetical protein B0H67DRAFT_82858 [Lasiosphaeris hirsuta]